MNLYIDNFANEQRGILDGNVDNHHVGVGIKHFWYMGQGVFFALNDGSLSLFQNRLERNRDLHLYDNMLGIKEVANDFARFRMGACVNELGTDYAIKGGGEQQFFIVLFGLCEIELGFDPCLFAFLELLLGVCVAFCKGRAAGILLLGDGLRVGCKLVGFFDFWIIDFCDGFRFLDFIPGFC